MPLAPDAPPAARVPVHLTGFVGREAQIAEIGRLLSTARLLTLTGAGGSGKTRLALEAVARMRGASGPEIAWVELAPLEDPALVPQQVARGLDLREEGRGSAVEALVRTLGAAPTLLVLDNCEHVVEACAELVDTLLRACPSLRVLATSREPLGVAGERAWLVPPLSLPAPESAPEAIRASEAVRLFTERAQEARPTFALTGSNLHAVVEICRRLDGLPLAIELAAARVRVLSPEQIAARLDDAFRLLSGGGRGTLPRHRTLRAVMDWSYGLLAEPSRTLLRRLAVFQGGFTLEAVEAVCADKSIPAEDVLDLLTDLVDRSLVLVREREGAMRYDLLETVRQYAAERLAESGVGDRLMARHAAFFTRLAEEAEPHLTNPERREWVDGLYAELENLRHALAWSHRHERRLHLRLVGLLGWFWFSSRHWAEGRQRLEEALALPESARADRERAAALFAAGVIATLQGDPATARGWLEESTAIAVALGDARLEAYSLNYLGMAHVLLGAPEGRAATEAALAWFRGAGELYGLRLALLILSSLSLAEGKLDDAGAFAEEGVRVARRFGQDRELAIALQCEADVALARGDRTRAASLYREALSALERDPFYVFIARAMEHVALIRCDEGAFEESTRLFGAAAAVRRTVGAAPFPADRVRYEPRLARAREALGDSLFDRAWDAGQGLSTAEAIRDALEPDAPAPAPPAAAPPPPGTRPDLRVRALGPLEIEIDGEPRSGGSWSHSRPRELLLLLLCHPEGRTREQIGVELWPEADAAQVKNRFHVALHHLRKALGHPEWIVLEDERYRLDPALECWLDAHAFEARVTAALRETGAERGRRLADALSLYRGDFLEGERVGDWHLEVHDRLRRLYVDGLSALADLQMQDDPAAAAGTLERLVRVEDLREDAHRRLMLCLARTGRRDAALRHYARLVTLLRVELDAGPEPETRALAEEIGGATHPRP
jgi:predicted ATPase/DNA-binding SARP family transcriptional activator